MQPPAAKVPPPPPPPPPQARASAPSATPVNPAALDAMTACVQALQQTGDPQWTALSTALASAVQ
eukprot:15183427-Alexandrium_andersonii.AAC.1